jgi:hypothetical protein
MCYGRTLLRDGFGKLAASGPSCLPAALALGLQVRGTNRDTGRGGLTRRIRLCSAGSGLSKRKAPTGIEPV